MSILSIKYEEIVDVIGRAILNNGDTYIKVANGSEISCRIFSLDYIEICKITEDINISERMYIENNNITNMMHFSVIKEGIIGREYIKEYYNGVICNNEIYVQNE